VTPLQMAMAYGALANGGELMEPRLVREVRSRDGKTELHFPPRVVRRVITEEVADAMRGVLVDAVATGSGQRAALGPFEVAGKTGTVRIAANGGYRAGAYTASFAGFFPARDPQLVFIVKLDEPSGQYYGGATAAPVTRATLEAALAARSTPLDRGAMAKAGSAVAQASVPEAEYVPTREAVLLTGRIGVAPVAAARGTAPMVVPDVSGMPMRDGVRRLHAAGFRLRLEGSGRIERTVPGAGAAGDADEVVRVIGGGAA
ncbi:MAG TPA: penicillin-binding transpeptidase domain-containing protein, partial [Longimicrobiales bacterium]|nr:penicillin-binding transpeptidase domain-containing protein [Longimicrobiales bacterium]